MSLPAGSIAFQAPHASLIHTISLTFSRIGRPCFSHQLPSLVRLPSLPHCVPGSTFTPFVPAYRILISPTLTSPLFSRFSPFPLVCLQFCFCQLSLFPASFAAPCSVPLTPVTMEPLVRKRLRHFASNCSGTVCLSCRPHHRLGAYLPPLLNLLPSLTSPPFPNLPFPH